MPCLERGKRFGEKSMRGFLIARASEGFPEGVGKRCIAPS